MPTGNEIVVSVQGAAPLSASLESNAGSSAAVDSPSPIAVSISGTPLTVGGGETISVSVPGSSASSPTITNGCTAEVTVTSVGDRGPKGDAGPQATTIAVGSVATGSPGSSASVTATSSNGGANLTLDFTIPRGVAGATGATGATGNVGPQGIPGPANSLSIGGVTTLSAGASASATISGTAPNQTLSLSIPRGSTGPAGQNGAAATVAVGSVTTGNPGTSAAVTNAGTSTNAVFNFTIPQGPQGEQGSQGPQGEQGIQGQEGSPGASTSIGTITSAATPTASITDGVLDITFPSLAIGTIDSGTTPTASIASGLLNITFPTATGGTGGITWSSVPTSPASVVGQAGDIARDANYLYVCSSPGDWKRTPLSAWTVTDPWFADVTLLMHFDSSPFVDSSSLANTVSASGSVEPYGGVFGSGAIFWNGSSLSVPYSAAWDMDEDFSIEFWVFGRYDMTRRRILGTNGWGVFVTPQDEQDYGTLNRVEAIVFDEDGNIVSRQDAGPMVLYQWNFYRITGYGNLAGTQPGGQPSWTAYNMNFYGLNAFSSPLVLEYPRMDELRITKGQHRAVFPSGTVPPAPFPDA